MYVVETPFDSEVWTFVAVLQVTEALLSLVAMIKKTRLCPALDYMDCKYSVHLEKRELMFIEKKFSLTNKLRKFEKKIYHKIVASHFFHENTDLILALHKFVL